MACIARHLPVDPIYHRMRLAADAYAAAQAALREPFQSGKDARPTVFPNPQQRLACCARIAKCGIVVAIRLFTVISEKIGASESHVPGQVTSPLRRLNSSLRSTSRRACRPLAMAHSAILPVVAQQIDRIFQEDVIMWQFDSGKERAARCRFDPAVRTPNTPGGAPGASDAAEIRAAPSLLHPPARALYNRMHAGHPAAFQWPFSLDGSPYRIAAPGKHIGCMRYEV